MRFGRIIFCFIPLGLSSQLQNLTADWEKDPALRFASMGLCVVDVRSGKTVAAYNASKAMIPASTLKIASTSAALGILGPGFRYETRICHTGTFDQLTGILNGDLIIAGGGDPSLQSEYFGGPKEPVTDRWAVQLREKGLKGITGSIIADASCFQRTVPGDWIWSDISNYFGAVPCGLSYMDNKFSVYFKTGKTGSTASITAVADGYLKHRPEISARVVAAGQTDQAYVYGDPFGWKKEIRGSIPAGQAHYQVEAAMPDPALRCAEALYTSLVKAGIKCQSQIRSVYDSVNTSGRTVLLRHLSPTLDQIIYYTNLKSNNLYCESLVMTLGQGSHEEGIRKVKAYWQERGLDPAELFMSDGSGLSRANTVTPSFQAEMLGKIARDSLGYQVISASMPLAGRQGSMYGVGRGTAIEGRLRAKTGYISRARAYCGYVTSASGRLLAFSVMLNNYNCSPAKARLILENFMVKLAEL